MLATWQALASSGLLFRDVVPSLWRIVAAIAATLTTQTFYANLRVTAVEFVVAIAIGSLSGIVVGLVLGTSLFMSRAYERWVHYLAPVPKIIFFPVLLLAFGAGPELKIAMGAISCFFPVAISVAAGVRGVPPVLIRVGRSFRAPMPRAPMPSSPACRSAWSSGCARSSLPTRTYGRARSPVSIR